MFYHCVTLKKKQKKQNFLVTNQQYMKSNNFQMSESWKNIKDNKCNIPCVYLGVLLMKCQCLYEYKINIIHQFLNMYFINL